MRRKHQAASALLTGILGAVTLFCARETGQLLPLHHSLLAAGSFVAEPAAAAAAALHTLEELMPPDARPAQATAPEPSAVPAPQATAPPPPQTPQPTAEEPPPPGAGRIVSAHYQQGTGHAYIPCGSGTIKNCTSLSDSSIAQTIAQGLPFQVQQNSPDPQVLIMHTHTTESYESVPRSWYAPDTTSRTTEPSANVTAVGTAMARQLNEAGIHTIQDTTLHDYPSYNGSYARSHQTVQNILQQYPSIRVVIDVHRDAIIQQDGTWVKPLAELPDTGPCAQVMLICGADKGGNLPNFRQNLRFAAAWQAAMAADYPGLARPVLFDYRYYNQDLTTGSLLLEVGGHANTLEEAITAGTLAGRALAKTLTAG